MTRLCSVQGCAQKHEAKGFCKAHWHRWRRYGDPLVGRSEIRQDQIIQSGNEALFLLDVALGCNDSDGCVEWPFRTDTNGYAITRIAGARHYVPTIVCRTCHGAAPSNRHEVAHSCGRGHLGCVAPNHLRWATRKENQADSILHGTKNRGERAGSNKLTAGEVLEIFALRGIEASNPVAARYGVSGSQVLRIFNQTDWAWLTTCPPSICAQPGEVVPQPASPGANSSEVKS